MQEQKAQGSLPGDENKKPDETAKAEVETINLNLPAAIYLVERNGIKYTPQAPVTAFCPGHPFRIILDGNKSLVGGDESYIILEGDEVSVKGSVGF